MYVYIHIYFSYVDIGTDAYTYIYIYTHRPLRDVVCKAFKAARAGTRISQRGNAAALCTQTAGFKVQNSYWEGNWVHKTLLFGHLDPDKGYNIKRLDTPQYKIKEH